MVLEGTRPIVMNMEGTKPIIMEGTKPIIMEGTPPLRGVPYPTL
jgi:hypothetical protein